MKNFVVTILYGLMIFFVSCEEEDLALEKALPVENSEVFSLNSKENKGFSVGHLKIANFPKTDADFIIIPQTSLTGDVMAPFLSNPNLEKRFILSDEFGDSKSAQAYFESYKIYPEGEDLQQFALEIKPNQIWLVKDHAGVFCKLLILDTRVDKNTSYVEIKFKAGKII